MSHRRIPFSSEEAAELVRLYIDFDGTVPDTALDDLTQSLRSKAGIFDESFRPPHGLRDQLRAIDHYARTGGNSRDGKIGQQLRDAYDRGVASSPGATGLPEPSGYERDSALRRAIELHAMRVVRDWLIQEGFEVEDTSASRPYDFEARRRSELRHVEVKGTRGDGSTVFVTAGEVRDAREMPGRSVLAVVAKIEIEGNIASGGELKITDPWVPVDQSLEPTAYRHDLTVAEEQRSDVHTGGID